jgi:hypothetical protein
MSIRNKRKKKIGPTRQLERRKEERKKERKEGKKIGQVKRKKHLKPRHEISMPWCLDGLIERRNL